MSDEKKDEKLTKEELLKWFAEDARKSRTGVKRRLFLADQCEILAAIKAGYAHDILARAFGVSAGTISKISRASIAGPYRQAAHILAQHGERYFIEKYLTEDFRLRLTRLKYNVPQPLDDRS